MENVERVMLVCDPGMVQFGYADIVRKELQKRKNDVKIEVFSDVEQTHQQILFMQVPK